MDSGDLWRHKYQSSTPRTGLIQRLETAKRKLTPIIDDIIKTACDVFAPNQNDNKISRTLTKQQYADILWASNVLNQTGNFYYNRNYDFNHNRHQSRKQQEWFNRKDYGFPFASYIVNNVDTGNRNAVVIDEDEIKKLVHLYRQLGEVIQRIARECHGNDGIPGPSTSRIPDSDSFGLSPSKFEMENRKCKSKKSHVSSKGTDFDFDLSTDECYCEDDSITRLISRDPSPSGDRSFKRSNSRLTFVKDKRKSSDRFSSYNTDPEDFDVMARNRFSSESKSSWRTSETRASTGSTASNKTFTINVPKKKRSKSFPRSNCECGTQSESAKGTKASTKSKSTNDLDSLDQQCSDTSGTIYITIRCFSDADDTFQESTELSEQCKSNCSYPCKHHDGTKPVHLRLDGEPVTVKVNQDNTDDDAVYYINAGCDEDENIKIVIKKCPECCSTVIASTSKIKDKKKSEKEDVKVADKTGDSHESITLHGKPIDQDSTDMTLSSDEDTSEKQMPDTSGSEGKKMNVILDPDDLNRSIIKFDDPQPPKRKPIVLTRTKVCSSHEFEVETVDTKLREKGIEHKNTNVVVQLNDFGVNKLLRASRPAKCCRKAILDEKQRVALPYSVSLRSLPLVPHDMKIIEQSFDMSVRKIKNSTDLTQDFRDTMAYYVNLGQDDFRSNINFPWVTPAYDIKCVKLDDESRFKNDHFEEDNLKILKPVFESNLTSILRELEMCEEEANLFVLKRSRHISDSAADFILKSKIRRQKYLLEGGGDDYKVPNINTFEGMFEDNYIWKQFQKRYPLSSKMVVSKEKKSVAVLVRKKCKLKKQTTFKQLDQIHHFDKTLIIYKQFQSSIDCIINDIYNYYIKLTEGSYYWHKYLPRNIPKFQTLYFNIDPDDQKWETRGRSTQNNANLRRSSSIESRLQFHEFPDENSDFERSLDEELDARRLSQINYVPSVSHSIDQIPSRRLSKSSEKEPKKKQGNLVNFAGFPNESRSIMFEPWAPYLTSQTSLPGSSHDLDKQTDPAPVRACRPKIVYSKKSLTDLCPCSSKSKLKRNQANEPGSKSSDLSAERKPSISVVITSAKCQKQDSRTDNTHFDPENPYFPTAIRIEVQKIRDKSMKQSASNLNTRVIHLQPHKFICSNTVTACPVQKSKSKVDFQKLEPVKSVVSGDQSSCNEKTSSIRQECEQDHGAMCFKKVVSESNSISTDKDRGAVIKKKSPCNPETCKKRLGKEGGHCGCSDGGGGKKKISENAKKVGESGCSKQLCEVYRNEGLFKRRSSKKHRKDVDEVNVEVKGKKWEIRKWWSRGDKSDKVFG